MYVRYTIPNDYNSAEGFERLISIVATFFHMREDRIEDYHIWEYLSECLPINAKPIYVDNFSQIWEVPDYANVDVDGFWVTVLDDIQQEGLGL